MAGEARLTSPGVANKAPESIHRAADHGPFQRGPGEVVRLEGRPLPELLHFCSFDRGLLEGQGL